METIEIIVEETVQPIILEVYQETTPPIVLESFEGKSGYSAYEIALLNGFVGTEAEWLESLKGADGTGGGVWGQITGNFSSQTDLQNALNQKVDKVSGKQLSTEDYTTTEKTKLSTIASGAEVNVNADWNATSGDSEILNKPTIPSISGLATISYVDSQDALKVDKVTGKSLISDSEITRLSTVTNFDNSGNVTALANKVDKVTGKSLVLDTEITRLGTMATNANVGVVPNTAITGATKTKITYDAKGLVIGGADATTADIADSTNKRYVSDSQSTVIGNTSGTNSGDNATNTQYSGLVTSKEDTANKSTTTADSASSVKFPVWSAILSYFDASRIRTLLGITTLSGSNTGDQNLSNLTKIIVKNANAGSTITGTTAETLVDTHFIAANTFNANDVMRIASFVAEKTGTAGTCTMRVKVGTTATFGSATTIATYTTSTIELWCIMSRMALILRNGLLRGILFGSSRQSDLGVFSIAVSTTPFNTGIDNTVFTSLQLSNASDSVFQSNLLITN